MFVQIKKINDICAIMFETIQHLNLVIDASSPLRSNRRRPLGVKFFMEYGEPSSLDEQTFFIYFFTIPK